MSGAVTLARQIDGRDFHLIFKFGTVRLAEQEIGGGESVFDLMSSGRLGANALSALFWAVLQPKHRMVREASDDLIDAAGVEQVGAWIGEGLRRYFGKDAGEDGGQEGNAGPAKRKKASRLS